MSDENYGYPSEGLESLCLCETDADSLELALVDVIEVGGNPAAGLATVATTGEYADLLNKPVIPTTAAQVGAVAAEAGKRLLTAEEAATLQTIDPEATKNRPDAELLARSNHTGSQEMSTVVGLADALDGKVVKQTGKGLTSNDYTDLEKIKLGRVADDATKNSPDAVLLARQNHTGTQAMSTIDGLAAALAEKLSPVPGMGLSHNDYTDADKAIVTGLGTDIADLKTGKVDVVPGKGLSSSDYTLAEKQKLASLANYDPTALQAQVTALSTSKVDKVAGKGLSTEDFTSAEKTKLSGLSNFDASAINATLSSLQANKVDKSGNKVLSTEDYSTAEKAKLAGIAAGATVNAADQTLLARANHTGTQSIATVTGLQDALDARVLSIAGSTLMTAAQSAKLASVASGATVNQTDAFLVSRANHTGTQAQSTIVGLETALADRVTADNALAAAITAVDAKKVDAVANKGLSTNDYTTAEKTKLAGLANYNDATLVASIATKVDKVAGKGLSSTDFTQTEKDKLATLVNYDDVPLQNAVLSTVNALEDRVRDTYVQKVQGKGLSSTDYTQAEKDKLSSVAAGATANAADSFLINRANHQGTQPITSIVGLQTALSAKVDVVSGKALSSNDYTTAEKNKLALLEGSHYRGTFVSLSALTAGVAAPKLGDYADVDVGAGSDVQRYIWDNTDNKWVMQTGAPTSMTAAQVKALYEANADTNAFTDAEKLKLSGGLPNNDVKLTNVLTSGRFGVYGTLNAPASGRTVMIMCELAADALGFKVIIPNSALAAVPGVKVSISAATGFGNRDANWYMEPTPPGSSGWLPCTFNGQPSGTLAPAFTTELASWTAWDLTACRTLGVTDGGTLPVVAVRIQYPANAPITYPLNGIYGCRVVGKHRVLRATQQDVLGIDTPSAYTTTATVDDQVPVPVIQYTTLKPGLQVQMFGDSEVEGIGSGVRCFGGLQRAAVLASKLDLPVEYCNNGMYGKGPKVYSAAIGYYSKVVEPSAIFYGVYSPNNTPPGGMPQYAIEEDYLGIAALQNAAADLVNKPSLFLLGGWPTNPNTGDGSRYVFGAGDKARRDLNDFIKTIGGVVVMSGYVDVMTGTRLASGQDQMKAGFTDDNLHPNDAGYDAVSLIVKPYIVGLTITSASAAALAAKEFSSDITPWADSRGAQNWSTSTTPAAPLSRSPLWRMEARGQMVRMRYDQMQSVSGDSISQLKQRMLTDTPPTGITVTPSQVPPGIAWLQIGTNSVNASVPLGAKGVSGTLLGDLWWCIDWLVTRGHRVMLLAEWPRGDTSANSGLLTPDNQKLMYAYHNAILQIKTKNVWIVDVWPRAADPARLDAAPRPGMLNNDDLHQSIGIAEVTCDEGVRVMRDEMSLKRIKATVSSNGDQWDAALNPGGCLNTNPMLKLGTGGTVTPGTAFDGSVACTGVAPQGYTLSSSGGLKANGRFGTITMDDGTIRDAYFIDITGRATANNAYISLRQPGLVGKIASGDLLEALYECVVQNPNENFSCPGLMVDTGAAATRAYGGLSITNDKQMPTSLLRPSTYWVPRAAQLPVGATLPSQITLDFRTYFVLGGAYSATAGSDLSVASQVTIAYLCGSLRKVQPSN